MPVVRNVTAGTQVIASAKIARQYALSIPPGASNLTSDAELQVNTLPWCKWYVIVTAGPAGCSVTPLFGVTNTQLETPVIDYQAVTPPQLLVVGVPFVFDINLSANAISVLVESPAGGAGDASVIIILAASL